MKWIIIPAFWFLYWGICFMCTGTDKKIYQDPSKHVGSFVRGIPLFAAIAALNAWVVTLI